MVTDELVTGRLADQRSRDLQEGAEVRFVPSWSDVAPLVAQIARAGDLVLTVGAGDVTMIGPEILRLLGQRPDATAVAPAVDPGSEPA